MTLAKILILVVVEFVVLLLCYSIVSFYEMGWAIFNPATEQFQWFYALFIDFVIPLLYLPLLGISVCLFFTLKKMKKN
ncbi:MAG: hypothetical protein DIKNOCCD_01200 [bacterium]|nr:hypothetical protein [bacterium]